MDEIVQALEGLEVTLDTCIAAAIEDDKLYLFTELEYLILLIQNIQEELEE